VLSPPHTQHVHSSLTKISNLPAIKAADTQECGLQPMSSRLACKIAFTHDNTDSYLRTCTSMHFNIMCEHSACVHAVLSVQQMCMLLLLRFLAQAAGRWPHTSAVGLCLYSKHKLTIHRRCRGFNASNNRFL